MITPRATANYVPYTTAISQNGAKCGGGTLTPGRGNWKPNGSSLRRQIGQRLHRPSARTMAAGFLCRAQHRAAYRAT
ncbi:MAG: hypothetical protein KGL09_10795 [Pseudomonadota bacterium]|nr:hypothetical protein [Pseudomonadota bacterium]